MSLVALQPPDTVGLVAFHSSGLTEALALRFHDRPYLGPYEGAPLGLVGIDADGPVWPVTKDGVRASEVVEIAVRARKLARTSALGGDSKALATELGRLERDRVTWEVRVLLVGGGRARHVLSADDLERLADLMRRYGDGACWQATWPIAWRRRRTETARRDGQPDS